MSFVRVKPSSVSLKLPSRSANARSSLASNAPASGLLKKPTSQECSPKFRHQQSPKGHLPCVGAAYMRPCLFAFTTRVAYMRPLHSFRQDGIPSPSFRTGRLFQQPRMGRVWPRNSPHLRGRVFWGVRVYCGSLSSCGRERAVRVAGFPACGRREPQAPGSEGAFGGVVAAPGFASGPIIAWAASGVPGGRRPCARKPRIPEKFNKIR